MKGDKSSEREVWGYWERELNAWVKRHEGAIGQYVRYARWYAGDMYDLIDPEASPNLDHRWQTSLENMTNSATRSARADLFFRNPRIVVRPPALSRRPPFTPALARVETTLTNDTLDQVRYFRRARRALTDALLGPFGILKITYERDIAIDHEAISEHRDLASDENKQFLAFGTKMNAVEDQLHSVHIEEHGKILAAAQRGEIALPKPAIKYLKKHIAVHEAMRSTERPTETIRDASVVVRRKNLLEFFSDCTVDDPEDARWVGESFLARKVDVLANDEYDQKARDGIADATDRWVRTGVTMAGDVPTSGSFDNSDTLVRLYEIVDFVDGTVRLYGEGAGEAPLLERPYAMRSILPSGPYSLLSFMEHPFEGRGICPPVAFEAHQAAATAISSAMVSAAIDSLPRTMFNSREIDPSVAQQIKQAGTGEWIPVEPKSMEGVDLSKAWSQVPPTEIPAQNVAVLADQRSRIHELSGLGMTKMGGGDQANTATASALISEAASALSEDNASQVDDWHAYNAKVIVRLQRATFPKDKVVEVCGDEAMTAWPESWADRDIVNDRNVAVVPGSSRRRNTAIDVKFMSDNVIAMGSDPAFQGPTGAGLRLEIWRRIMEDMGLGGLDWEAVQQEQAAMAALQQQMTAMAGGAAGGGAPPEEGSPEEAAARPAEQTEGEPSSAAGGVANIGGGRVPTGASQGDPMRFVR